MSTLRMQSRDGSISPAGVRLVREAVAAGAQVQRADVLAIITEYFRLLHESQRVADVVPIRRGRRGR